MVFNFSKMAFLVSFDFLTGFSCSDSLVACISKNWLEISTFSKASSKALSSLGFFFIDFGLGYSWGKIEY